MVALHPPVWSHHGVISNGRAVCRAGKLLGLCVFGWEKWRDGDGGGAERKLYVILGWLLSNCFNQMECSVFSAYLAETALFFIFYFFGGERGEFGFGLFSSCSEQWKLDLSQSWKKRGSVVKGEFILLGVVFICWWLIAPRPNISFNFSVDSLNLGTFSKVN